MRGLKVLVIVMGITILGVVAVLAATVVGRMSRGTPTPPRPIAAAPIEIPRGARIEALSTEANRLVVALALPDGNRRLIILDLASGKQIGAIELHPAP
jgi:hypothetical protein